MKSRKKKLALLERRLQEERRRVLEQVEDLSDVFADTLYEADGDVSAYVSDVWDLGTDAMGREQAFMLTSLEAEELAKIDLALRKLYLTPEDYGRCEGCSADISFERLWVIPHARNCLLCQKLLEEGGTVAKRGRGAVEDW